MNALVKTAGVLLKSEGNISVGQKAVPEPVENKQYLTFKLSGEMFSIGILLIKEIIWYTDLTDVPMMPACIRGIINLRGSVVPVMDLSVRFGKPPTQVTKNTCIVIVEVYGAVNGQRKNMGIVVDAVQAVVEIASADIELEPTFGTTIQGDLIEGIAKVADKFVILLNVHKVLSLEEIGQMSDIVQIQ